MHLEDLQRIHICCTLWDNYAATMNDYIQSAKDRPLIVLLQLCRANKFKEVGVSNSLYNITRMFVNSSIPEIDQFWDRLPQDENMSPSQVSQVSVFSSQTIQDEVDNKVHEVVTLDAIPTINQDADAKNADMSSKEKGVYKLHFPSDFNNLIESRISL